MSDDRHLSDEELSDLLDGLGEAADAAHVGACAICTDRLAAWRHVVDLVGSADSPPAGAADEAVRNALGSGLDLGADPDDGPSAPVIAIRSRRLRLVGTAAAVVILVAGLAFVVGHLGHRSTSSTAASSATASPTSVSAQASGAASASSTTLAGLRPPAANRSTSPAATGSALTAPYLGSFTSLDAVGAAVDDRLQTAPQAQAQAGAASSTTTPSNTAPASTLPTCAADAPELAGHTAQKPILFSLDYQGSASVVFVYPGSSRWGLVVENLPDCRLEAMSTNLPAP